MLNFINGGEICFCTPCTVAPFTSRMLNHEHFGRLGFNVFSYNSLTIAFLTDSFHPFATVCCTAKVFVEYCVLHLMHLISIDTYKSLISKPGCPAIVRIFSKVGTIVIDTTILPFTRLVVIPTPYLEHNEFMDLLLNSSSAVPQLIY